MKVLIFGLGLNKGGVGSAKFFAQKGDQVKVTDLKNAEVLKSSLDQLKNFPEITYTLGKHKYEDIDWADLIIKNPSVKPGSLYLNYASKQRKKIETDIGIFLQYVTKDQIIGVTGTKGKSTTASLIYEVLKTSRENVVLAGNIGKSVLETIPQIKPDTLVILEISSFQLESFEAHSISPKWAVITNITPDHLNYYKSMDEYIRAKKIIGKYQKAEDFLFLGKDDPITTQPNFLKEFKAQIIYYSKNDLPKNLHPKLLGEHNLENIAAAFAAAKTLDLASQGDAHLAKRALRVLGKFQGVEFRLQKVYGTGGIEIYNDTAATSPAAGIQAIKTFSNLHSHIGSGKLNIILICGGMNKGMDYLEFTEAIKKFVKKVFFLEGDSTEEIQRLLEDTSNPYNDLEKLLTDVKKIAKPRDIILFSPAATSFNLFQNEFDRGRKFNTAVEKIFK